MLQKTICTLKSQYIGSEQHDSQEFLSFLLDGIHEDLNRVLARPPPKSSIQQHEEEEELERLPMQIGSEREWKRWRERNDSIIVDFFQGQFQSRLECKTCHKVSVLFGLSGSECRLWCTTPLFTLFVSLSFVFSSLMELGEISRTGY